MLRVLQIGSRVVLRQQLSLKADLITVAKFATALKGQDVQTLSFTMDEVRAEIRQRLGLQRGYHPIPRSREHLLKYTPKAEDLPPRSMQDSYTTAVLPLSTDLKLQDNYVSHLGNVRMGRLMEDLDSFAVWVVHQHIKVPTLPANVNLPYTFVTILVDKVSFSDLVTNVKEDIRFSGHMSWVGRSSMEIVVWLEQKHHGEYKKITRALFLMGARNATNTGPAPVNPIEPATDEERKILSGGEERKKRRQIIQAQSIFRVEPNDFEQTLMYDIYKRTTDTNTMELNKRLLPANARWMSEWSTVTTIPSFPENRNAHNKVFGGFLMRLALENSWTAAFLYCCGRPKLLHICDISFEKPVPVSSFIKLTSYVVYTELNYLQIMTVVDVLDASGGGTGQVTTNAFYSTYKSNEPVHQILPRSYHETMWYIQGRRKFKYAMGLE
ncbi:acyl-coenzyme A thioesterase 9, mitochondrial-like isoform X1 [Rhagoletis pomonella]|uniref:acyl-coenzyme A thioesterase 9, mitochondrial-like isoform X1 n=1 Tax=Rhagoletis pomonella TaxID=28610 RepID=UPI001784E0AA|nr:acyl-coenzyme A thioesterase 9, mitochondrial-like isoform X1 [Rhagoletis pomonella]